VTTKNDYIILVTGAAGIVGTELVKQLSTACAIFRAGASTLFYCKSRTTLKYVNDTIFTLQPGFGQIWDADGSDGGYVW
jgi:nucleoside-diphosphate-sugar epimerase